MTFFVNPIPVLFGPDGTVLMGLTVAFWLAVVWTVIDFIRTNLRKGKSK